MAPETAPSVVKQLKSVARKTLGDVALGRLDYFRFPDRRESWGGPFNGQAHRRRMFADIVAAYQPAAIVETGTFRGTTTDHMASCFDGPILTVEFLHRNFGYAKQRLAWRRNIRTYRDDSRAFLRRLTASADLPFGRCFFYLDAHWGEDLPLAEELEIIFSSRPDAVAMIDDFEVPGDAGYGFDDYGPGKVLNRGYVTPAMETHGLRAFYPSIGSNEETGAKRGSIVLGRASDIADILETIPSLRSIEI